MGAGEYSSSISIGAGRCMLSLAEMGIEAVPAAAECLTLGSHRKRRQKVAKDHPQRALFALNAEFKGPQSGSETCWA